MSVVAVSINEKFIEIASDSITVRGCTQEKGKNKFTKLVKINNIYLGAVGTAEETSLLQVFLTICKPEYANESGVLNFFSEFSNWKSKRVNNSIVDNDYIMVFDGKVFAIESFFVQEITNYFAIGAGRDFALATLYLNKDVKKAIEVACELSIYCEKPVTYYKVKK